MQYCKDSVYPLPVCTSNNNWKLFETSGRTWNKPPDPLQRGRCSWSWSWSKSLQSECCIIFSLCVRGERKKKQGKRGRGKQRQQEACVGGGEKEAAHEVGAGQGQSVEIGMGHVIDIHAWDWPGQCGLCGRGRQLIELPPCFYTLVAVKQSCPLPLPA